MLAFSSFQPARCDRLRARPLPGYHVVRPLLRGSRPVGGVVHQEHDVGLARPGCTRHEDVDVVGLRGRQPGQAPRAPPHSNRRREPPSRVGHTAFGTWRASFRDLSFGFLLACHGQAVLTASLETRISTPWVTTALAWETCSVAWALSLPHAVRAKEAPETTPVDAELLLFFHGAGRVFLLGQVQARLPGLALTCVQNGCGDIATTTIVLPSP